MEVHSDDECPLLLGEYIRSNPSSAISARWVFELPDEEQGDCVAKMVENAVYQETWLSYFKYAAKKEIPVTEEIALEAIHSVGLDPYSAPLWLKVVELCSNEEKKRKYFNWRCECPCINKVWCIRHIKRLSQKSPSKLDNPRLTFCHSLKLCNIPRSWRRNLVGPIGL
ncbi:uncharacterized protein Tco025E_07446 [Trypanosoma conorhini]|uniref:Uncharacterized protein n=1 Tax=Trypanosoma conorhini TaxID=83891 RepID=A0A3R7M0Z5_9TRYP|nr:uncharacterized protein Tco025E_07446 [Trypanosoma conorhini]RNF07061.1 hypothetical protein Tco025E_07446 [Trypanosoma conorhini]